MTQTESQLQSFIDKSRVVELSRSWNRTSEEIDEACSSFLSRRLASVAVSDFDEEL